MEDVGFPHNNKHGPTQRSPSLSFPQWVLNSRSIAQFSSLGVKWDLNSTRFIKFISKLSGEDLLWPRVFHFRRWKRGWWKGSSKMAPASKVWLPLFTSLVLTQGLWRSPSFLRWCERRRASDMNECLLTPWTIGLRRGFKVLLSTLYG